MSHLLCEIINFTSNILRHIHIYSEPLACLMQSKLPTTRAHDFDCIICYII